jgi:hypothetical protein
MNINILSGDCALPDDCLPHCGTVLRTPSCRQPSAAELSLPVHQSCAAL